MSDALEHEVKIIINIVSNLKEASRELDNYSESVGGLPRSAQKAVDAVNKQASALSKVVGASKDATSASKGLTDILTLEERKAGDATRQWELYAKSLSNANRARLQDQNATNARNINPSRTGSVFDQGQTYDTSPVLRAADTSWARDFTEATKAQEEMLSSLPRLRYALYDVAQTAGITSGAITAFGAAALVASAKYESAFTGVERTSGVVGQSAEDLRGALMQLSREIPQTFDEIAGLATRGAQLGIAAQQIDGFTETVAQFVATSDTVTLDQAVEAFGRISNLMGDTDFNRIGSSITLVGVNAAATEAQIVKTTQELAPFATAVGMSTDEVIGLAAALGSLGQPPERARSAFLTLQRVVDNAIAGQTENLGAFAEMLNMTAKEVEDLWQQDPGAFIAAFSRSLGSVDDLTGAFARLGIHERRAVQVFQALASDARNAGDGMSVLDRAFADANQGYVEGTELARQYGLILDDLSSKWQIMLNAIGEVAQAFGTTLAPAAKIALDLLTDMLHGLAAFAETPFGKIVTGFVGVIGALVAALLGAVSTSALALASMAAFRTALGNAAAQAGVTGIGIRSLWGAFTGLAGAVGISSTALRVFKYALISTGIGAAVVLVGTLVGAFAEAGDAFKTAEQRSREMLGGLSGLADALREDTAAGMEAAGAVREFTGVMPDQSDEIVRAAKEAENFAEVLGTVDEAAARSANKAKEVALIWGGASTEYIRSQLRISDDFKKLVNTDGFMEFWTASGGDIDKAIEIAAAEGRAGIVRYVGELRAEVARQASGPDGIINEQLHRLLYGDQHGAGALDTDVIINSLGGLGDATQEIANVATVMGDTLEGAGATAADAGDDFEEFGRGIAAAVSDFIDAEGAILSLENQMFSLGSTVGQNTGMWDEYSEAGRANLGALHQTMSAIAAQSPHDTAQIASNFMALYDALIAGGVATQEQLARLHAEAAALAGTASVLPRATINFNNLFGGIAAGADKARRAVGGGGGGGGGLKKEIRTLVDYANDLSKVFSRSFDLRFGTDQGADSITSGWYKIRDAADAAREAADKHRRSLADMGADRSIKQYWLSVAENYGDELRAQKLRAELADLDADMAKERKALTKAQDQASMSLVGNSEAAIENRAAILSMVGDHQDYLEVLASSGMSQADLEKESRRLRAEFVQQATSLGYNRGEVEKYAKSFDDITAIIRRVPRNVTIDVKSNSNPALQALREFDAQIDKLRANAGRAINVAGGSLSGSALKQMRGLALMAELQALQHNLRHMHASPETVGAARNMANQIKNISARLNSGNYWTGGYVGDGGMYQPKGIVHGGEFVFSKAATRTIGVNNLEAMHSLAKSGRPFMPAATGPSGVVTLSAQSINDLARAMLAGAPSIVLPGAQLAGSVGEHNKVSASRGRA